MAIFSSGIVLVCGFFFFFFQAEDGIRDLYVTGVQTCALPISSMSPTAMLKPRNGSVTEPETLGWKPFPTVLIIVRGCRIPQRSEERRVGKECRSRGWPDH